MLRKPSSLFVGRWQPFHAGHQALIETVLKQGKPVVVAIRDTPADHNNPFSVSERWEAIQNALRGYGSLVRIVVLPDIDEICYGRDVGYGIRRIDLSAELQSVSGTKTRREKPPTKSIIWLTGQSGAGKTTLAQEIKKLQPEFTVLDGDEMRESISLGAGFSKEEREEHNLRVARLAVVLSRQAPVVVSVIAPFEKTRVKIDDIAKPVWVHVKRALPINPDKPYELPESPQLVVDTDLNTPEQNAKKVLNHILQQQRGADK